MKKLYNDTYKFIIIFILIIIFVLIGNMFINVPVSIRNEAYNGKLEIENTIDKIDGIISLDGEWDFYYSELLDYDHQSINPALTVKVPSSWNNKNIYSNQQSKFGYGTYKLDVNLANASENSLALYIHCIPCAYKIFIDDKLIAQNGKLGNSLDTEQADIRPRIINFIPPSDEFTITMQISNYHFAKGGFWTSMYLGTCQSINKYNQIKMIRDIFIMGIIFAVGILYFFMYISGYKVGQQFYFSMLCLLAILLIDFDNNMLIYKSFSNMSYETMVRLWYFPSSVISFLVVLYVVKFFNFDKYKVLIYILGILSLLSLINDLFVPVQIRTGLTPASNIISGLCLSFSIYVVILSLKNYRKTAIIYLTSFLIILVSFIYDYMFYHTNIYNLNIGVTITYAIALIVILQAYIFLDTASTSKDYLTGLTARYRLDGYVEYLLMKNTEFILVIVDMDKFKSINDNYGHLIGDKALVIFSNSLSKVFKDADMIARYAGDEFIIVTKKLDEYKIKEKFNLLLDILAKQIKDQGLDFKLEFSYGCQKNEVNKCYNYQAIFNAADKKMYADKMGKLTK